MSRCATTTRSSFYRYCQTEDILDKNPALNVRGGEHVTIPIAPRPGRALDLYIGERTMGPIFLGVEGGRMDRYCADRHRRVPEALADDVAAVVVDIDDDDRTVTVEGGDHESVVAAIADAGYDIAP